MLCLARVGNARHCAWIERYFVNDTPGTKISVNQTSQSTGRSAPKRRKVAAPGSPTSDPAPASATPIIAVSDVNYSVDVAGRPLHILKSVGFRIEAAEVVAIVGPSGSGKTSL